MSNSKFGISFNPMLCFFISCVPLIFLSESFTQRTLQLCEGVLKLLSIWFCEKFSKFLVSRFQKSRIPLSFVQIPMTLVLKKMALCSTRVENVEENERISLLDLPELTLECIFERLSPAGLCSMAGVCSSLRERCTSDHLWEIHLKQKWGKVIGDTAYQEWQCQVASRNGPSLSGQDKKKGLFESLLSSRPFSWITPKLEKSCKVRTTLPVDSIMAWYLSLESGNFWFPAQVYNRENGHIGFMLSCYDALLCYNSETDNFHARYSSHGRRTLEENIGWDRLRAPPVNTPPFVLHVSDCLPDLKPGDYIEIQWRRNKEFPYGWWYGHVDHLEPCDGNETLCRCHYSDTVVLKFNQYSSESRWRRTLINRKDHREEGNEVDGFYGGIRKLYKEEEIARWKHFWPAQVLEQ
ncbi:hypothetical protein CsatB_019724 [Cannabis sativa]|uniref:F-box domain-containing protein n=2 Tax=Cannabis sativa TaxID=3483 RepID=A0A803QPN3_CANSA